MESNISPCKFDCEVCDANFQEISSVVNDSLELYFGNDVRETRNGKWEIDSSSHTCHTEAEVWIKTTSKGYSVWVDCSHSYTYHFWGWVILGLLFWVIGAVIPVLCFL